MTDTKKRNAQAFMQPMEISKELQAVIGAGPMPRSEVIRKLWDYIKRHNRQDPHNKRNIVPDEKLATLFGTKSPVDMFTMTKLVSKHIRKPATTAASRT